MNYIGRFAPSPTGPLHEGSLLTALASYLEAKKHHGLWLVRIEDLDQPRCQQAHEKAILEALEAYGLLWDKTVMRQTDRIDRYTDLFQSLIAQGQAYRCGCSRTDLKSRHALPHYDRYCLLHPANKEPTAVRFKVEQCSGFDDLLQGSQPTPSEGVGDFILYRRDGIVAYQLAVVLDDYEQGVTDIVRGSDLLDETHKQRALQLTQDYPLLKYAHLPLVLAADGQKLSKQTFASALPTQPLEIIKQLKKAMVRLGQIDEECDTPSDVGAFIQFALDVWDIQKVPKVIKNS